MFNRPSWWLLVVLFGLAVTTPAAAEGTATCRAHGQAALLALTQGHYDQVGKDFAPAMGGKATPSAMKKVWTEMQAQAGAFQRLGALAPKTINGRELLLARMDFSGTPLAAAVGCDAQGRVDALFFMPASAVAPPPPMPATPNVAGVVSRAVQVPSPAGPLPGTLTLPQGKGPFPAVLLVAGSGALDGDETVFARKPFRDIALGLAKAGVASLRYDKRTYAYPLAFAAGKPYTVDDEVTDDALSALKLLGVQPGIDAKHLFVLGNSLGGYMAPRIGQRDPRLAGLILLAAPARSIVDIAIEQTREQGARAGTAESKIAATVASMETERKVLQASDAKHPPMGAFQGVPQSYWVSLHDYHPVTVAKSLSMPMLVLQGAKDFEVSPTHDFSRWQAVFAHDPHVQFHEYPGLGHLFMPAGKTGTPADYKVPAHVDPQVIHDIASWVKRRSKRQTPSGR